VPCVICSSLESMAMVVDDEAESSQFAGFRGSEP
jgi:hypothetical protein